MVGWLSVSLQCCILFVRCVHSDLSSEIFPSPPHIVDPNAARVKDWLITDRLHCAEDVQIALYLSDNCYVLRMQFLLFNETEDGLLQNHLSANVDSQRQLLNYSRLYGPDEIVLFVEGKQLVSSIPSYVGRRVYSSRVCLAHTGYYHVKVVRLREHYRALNEVFDEYPLIRKEYILNEWLHLDAVSVKRHHYWNLKPSLHHKLINVSATQSTQYNLVLLNALPPIVYKEEENRNLTYEIYVPVGPTKPDEGCSEDVQHYQWTHFVYNATLQHEQVSTVLANIQLIVIGDSHADRLTTALMNLYCGGIQGTQDSFSRQVSTDSLDCSNLTIHFRRYLECDMDLIVDALEHLLDPIRFTMFTLNCGHHPASSRHRSVVEYSSMVSSIMDVLDQHPSINKRNFVWIESTPMPFCNAHRAVIVHRDWRTIHRLSMFNHVANRIALAHNYSVIPAFQSLLPFVDGSTCDPWHFPWRAMLGVIHPLVHHIKVMKDLQQSS